MALYEKLGTREEVMHFDIATMPARVAQSIPASA